MKIATWNLERLSKNKNNEILDQIYYIDADIFVLTETSINLKLTDYHSIRTEILFRRTDKRRYFPAKMFVSSEI
ncbi:MAG: hypothetical protein QM751_11415 [Paludibacteraceae bacterium]